MEEIVTEYAGLVIADSPPSHPSQQVCSLNTFLISPIKQNKIRLYYTYVYTSYSPL